MNTTSRDTIATESVLLRLPGIHISSIDSLVSWMQGDPSGWIISDLSLGAWRGHHVAREFHAQLGLPYRAGDGGSNLPVMGEGGPPSYADIIGAGIDSEACGNGAVIHALELATAVLSAIVREGPLTFLVVAPRSGAEWEEENIAFIQFLVQGLVGSGGRLVLACHGDEELRLPEGWSVDWWNGPKPVEREWDGRLAGLVPGSIEPAVAEAVGLDASGEGRDYLRLRNDCVLVAPERRPLPGKSSRMEYDRLGAAGRRFPWLAGYAQCFGNNHYVESDFLCSEAWACFGDGGGEIALRLLDRAVSCARAPLLKGLYQAQAQGMRIALHRFAEVGDLPDPSPALPSMLRGFLLQTKGWGLAMSGRPDAADEYLQTANGLLGESVEGRERCYLLNITALNRLRLGDMEGALRIEKEIEGTVSAEEIADWRLRYVNAINIARLYRRRKEFDSAERYYRQAFATTLGVRSESDLIYTNICLAQLNHERGREELALVHWIRAALHWVSATVPEALGARVVGALTGLRLGRGRVDIERVAEIFTDILLRYFPGPDPPEFSDEEAPAFLRLDRLDREDRAGVELAVGCTGWGVLVFPGTLNVRSLGPRSSRLRIVLRRLAAVIAECPDLDRAGSLVVDDRFGSDLPATRGELLESCMRLRVPRMIFEGRTTWFDWKESGPHEMRVRLGPGVDHVERTGDRVSVSYKRYRSPVTLSVRESLIVSRLVSDRCEGMSFERISMELSSEIDSEDLRRLLLDLEELRIVHLYLSEDGNGLERLVSDRVRTGTLL